MLCSQLYIRLFIVSVLLPVPALVPSRFYLHRAAADTSFDASVPTFDRDYLSSGAERPDWVVTSPPYKGAIKFVKAALAVATVRVALKLGLVAVILYGALCAP